MYKKLVTYRNELKNKIIPKYKILGMISEIILSKELFDKNEDLEAFLLNVFSITYKKYVIKSRTIILARTIRLVHDSDEDLFITYKNNLTRYVQMSIETVNSKTKEKDIFKGWIG